MNVAFRIARRYLFSRKSHNVINIISGISMAGMAIGTAALIIILSVYNGFNEIVEASLSDVDPDLTVTPAEGKAFIPEGPAFDTLYADDDILTMSCIVEENVFVSYDGKQSLARAKGVDAVYEEESLIRNHLTDGEFTLHFGDVRKAVIGAGLAYKLGINPRFVPPVEIYFPDRKGKVSLGNPATSVRSVRVYPAGLFTVNAQMDGELLVVPIETMRELLGYEEEVSAVEIRFRDGMSEREKRKATARVTSALGDGYRVRDRYSLNETLFKMMKYEKLAIFGILIFIVIIIAFNVYSSLTMLIIEKSDDIGTLRSLGADERLIRRTFVLEGWLITLVGMVLGTVLGIGFVLLQRQFGFIKMPGNYLISAYPVILEWKDILLSVGAIAVIGYLIALIPKHKEPENV